MTDDSGLPRIKQDTYAEARMLRDKPKVEPLADPFRIAGKRCGVGHSKWYELLKAGELRTYTVGKRRYMTRAAQAEFIARREEEEQNAR